MTDDQKKFVELRSQGWTYLRIAEDLKVCRRTVINWSRKFQFEIQNERALELEALQTKFLATREGRIQALGEQLQAIDAELKKRDIAAVPTPRLFTLAASLRREIASLAGDSKFTTPTNDIPTEDFHEQVQDWSA